MKRRSGLFRKECASKEDVISAIPHSGWRPSKRLGASVRIFASIPHRLYSRACFVDSSGRERTGATIEVVLKDGAIDCCCGNLKKS